MTDPPSERQTPVQPLERRPLLPLEERVAQLEALIERERIEREAMLERERLERVRLEFKSTTSSAELLERQEHLDGCIDEVKVEVRAHGQQLLEQGAQIREQSHLIRGMDQRLDGVQGALQDVSGAVHRAAWATPAATTGGVGAAGAALVAIGRVFGWW